MLVLEGDQGSGKSTGIEALVPDTSWFTDDLPLNSESKETIERTTGRWIVEAAELGGLRRADVERLKSFLSRRTDTARLAYGRMATERARHFVVIGTTNDAAYLNDSTGNRRFWPVAVGRIDVPAIARDRDQLWAEAARLEARGQVVRLDPRLWQRAVAAQEERRLEDPWEQELGALLGARVGWLQSQDAWALVGLHDVGRRAQAEGARLGKALRKLGFERVKRKRAGSLSWWYYRGARFTNGGYAIQDQIQVVVRRDGEGRLSTEIRESGDVPF
jgi:predicted P-loop ATPase